MRAPITNRRSRPHLGRFDLGCHHMASLLIPVPESFLHFQLLHLLKELERFSELFLRLIGHLA
jgi:hypothetical protein